MNEKTKEEKLRKNLLILIILNLSLISFAIIYTVYFTLTEGTDAEIGCFVREKFHIYCPGCGGSRGLREFLKFNFISSFILFPPIDISAILVLFYDARLSLSLIKKDTSYTDNYRFYPFLLIPVSLLLNFIVRNVLLIFFKIDYIGDIMR